MRILLSRATLMLALLNLGGFATYAKACHPTQGQTQACACCDEGCTCSEGGECTCESCGCGDEGCCNGGTCGEEGSCGQGQNGTCDPNSGSCGCGCCGGGTCKPDQE